MYGTNLGQLSLWKMDANNQLIGGAFWTYPSKCENSKTGACMMLSFVKNRMLSEFYCGYVCFADNMGVNLQIQSWTAVQVNIPTR